MRVENMGNRGYNEHNIGTERCTGGESRGERMRAGQRGRKIKAAGIWNFILIMVLLFASMGVAFLLFQRTSGQYQARLEESGDELAESVRSIMYTQVEYLEGLAECFSIYEDIHSREALDTLVRIDKKNRFTRMWLIKMDGRAISSERSVSDAGERGYPEQAARGESGIWEVQTDRVTGRHSVVLFAPTSYEGRVTGIVAGILKMDALLDVINVRSFGGKSCRAVFTDDREVLVSSTGCADVSVPDSRYSYSAAVGILDWNIMVSLPENVIMEEIRADLFLAVGMGLVYVLLCGGIMVNVFRDRSRLLSLKASQDSLTQLANRGAIEQIVGDMGEGGEYHAVLAIFDIDKFKQVNDTMGHSVGDILLKAVAELMRREFGDADCLCRMGGDEFGIFIRQVEDREILLQRMDGLRNKVGRLSLAGSLKCTVSIGLVFVAGSGELNTFDTIYQRADKAMYSSKKAGGNRVTVYGAEKESLREE